MVLYEYLYERHGAMYPPRRVPVPLILPKESIHLAILPFIGCRKVSSPGSLEPALGAFARSAPE